MLRVSHSTPGGRGNGSIGMHGTRRHLGSHWYRNGRSRGVSVPAKFNIKAVVGATELECLWAEVVRTSVNVGSWVKGWVELAEGG